MAVSMAAAGMARHIFSQTIRLKKCKIFGNGSLLRLKYAHPNAIELVQRAAANATNYDCIHPLATEPRNRIAGPVLMDLVAVIDHRYFLGDAIHHDKPRCRPKMPIHLTL